MRKTMLMMLAAVLLMVFAAQGMAQAYPVVTDAFVWEAIPVPEEVSLKSDFDFYRDTFSSGMILVDTDNGDGYLRADGAVIKSKYAPWSDAMPFSDGAAYVCQEGYPKIIDTKGRSLFRISQIEGETEYRYDSIAPCADGIIRVELKVKRGEQELPSVGYWGKLGDLRVDPLEGRWLQGTDFSHGHAGVLGQDMRYRIIDELGREILELEEGESPVMMLSDSFVYKVGDEWILSDYSGGTICSLGMLSTWAQDDGLIFADYYEPENNKVYDQTGRIVADRELLLSLGVTNGGKRPYLPYIRQIDGGLIQFMGEYDGAYGAGYLNREGEIVVKPGAEIIRHDDWLIGFASDSGLCGLKDIEGSVAVGPYFEKIGPIEDNACLAVQDGKTFILRFYWEGKPDAQ